MIRILFFIERLSYNGSIGGAEKALCNLVNHIDKNQFHITVQTVFQDPMAQMLSDDINYRFLYKTDNKINNTLYRLESYLGLVYRFHLRGSYDIEAAYLEYGSTKVIAASSNRKAKKIAWIHCDFETAIKDKIAFIKKYTNIYNKLDRVVCVSEKVRNSYLKMFGDVTESEVLHNIIDSNEVYSKSQQHLINGLENNKFTLLTVGRFAPQKNYKRLLKTVKHLMEDGFDFSLWILGDGEERKEIETYIVDNNLSHVVTLFGFQENPYPFMREADLLVCSSNYEGYSTFLTEGLILGKPILTTDCSGMRELLGDSEYGIIVDNDDQTFYEGLKKVLTHKDDIISDLQNRARRRSQDFKMEKLVKDTEEFLKGIIGEKN